MFAWRIYDGKSKEVKMMDSEGKRKGDEKWRGEKIAEHFSKNLKEKHF